MTKIIGISGRKQSGKSTLTKFLIKNRNLLFPKYSLFPIWHGDGSPKSFCEERPVKTPTIIQCFPMAGPLKKFCHEVLGLTYEQCYGTDADKETLTRYRWEDMPMYEGYLFAQAEKFSPTNETFEYWIREAKEVAPSGFMTARQVLQQIGTEMGRRFNVNLWCEANTRAIQNSGVDVALIDDIRFENEVEATKEAGGVVIRLTRRDRNAVDPHASESALDGYTKFDRVVDSQNMSLGASLIEIVKYLGEIGMAEKVKFEDLVL